MRILLVTLLVHGLVPDFAEAAEAALHYVRTGHVAHTEADHGDLGDLGCEHGCGSTQHRCTCCSTQPMAQSGEVVVSSLPDAGARRLAPAGLKLAAREPERPFRPPIS